MGEEIFDPESNFTEERIMEKMDRAYSQSYRNGRGIKRLTCLIVGFIPFWVAMFTLSVIALFHIFLVWLVLPKEKYQEWAEENNV